MCLHCEATGLPPITTKVVSFASRDEALTYAKKREWQYLIAKQTALLHLFGLLDMNADLFRR